MCSKVKYNDKKTVNTFINAHKGKHNKRGYLRAYYCIKCESWHVTSHDKREIKDYRLILKHGNEFKKYIQ